MFEKYHDYLKQFAAMQFPGSIQNMGTHFPIHLLQKLEPCWDGVRVDIADVDTSCLEEYQFAVRCYGEDIYDTVEDLVLDTLGLADASEEDIQAYNKKIETGEDEDEEDFDSFRPEEPFRPFEPGQDDLETYLSAYMPDVEVYAYHRNMYWDTMAVAFSKQELETVREDLSNHIFSKTRIFSMAGNSFGRESGDYLPMMQFLMDYGTNLLVEDAKNVSIRTEALMSAPDVVQHYKKNPNTPVTIAQYRISSQDEFNGMCLVVVGTGHIEVSPRNHEYPVGRLHLVVMDADGNKTRSMRYPYECDGTGANLWKEAKEGQPDVAHRLYFYAKYCKEVL